MEKPSDWIKQRIFTHYFGDKIELPYAILDFLDEQAAKEPTICEPPHGPYGAMLVDAVEKAKPPHDCGDGVCQGHV